MHKVGVKAIVFANTPENQRLSKSVFKVRRIIDIVDGIDVKETSKSVRMRYTFRKWQWSREGQR